MSAPRAIGGFAPSDPRIDRLAGGLAATGVTLGDRVAWQLPNSPQVAALLWACWRIGAVAVPIHHRSSDTERAALLDPLGISIEVDQDRLDRLLAGADALDAASAPVVDGDAPALILHTSGSSGVPKGVIHTQASLGHKAARMVDIHGLGPRDTVLMPAPMAHISGVLNGVTLPAAAGMTTVFMDRWDPEHAARLIEERHVTFMVGPPTFFVDLMKATERDPRPLRSLALVSAGGAGVTEVFCRELSEWTGARVKRTYGSTEAPTLTTALTGGSNPDPEPWGHRTDGRAFHPTQIRIGENGEVQARGPELFVGYTDPERTLRAFTADGWLRTGDLGVLDDGWLTVTGRLSGMIIRGGENISPEAVTAVLARHPDLAEVAVLGVPDDRLGERVGVVVTVRAGHPAPTVDDLARWCGTHGLARFAHPERLAVADVLPRLASGKVDLQLLSQRLARSGD